MPYNGAFAVSLYLYITSTQNTVPIFKSIDVTSTFIPVAIF